MAVVDTLVTRYTMDNSDYVQGSNQVANSTQKIGKSIGGLGAAIPVVGAMLAALAGATVGALGAASRAGAEFEAQTKALSLYETAGMSTTKMLERLREVAKLPGLGNIEAIQGAVRLLAGGFDFTLAERAMLSFGNALAAAGGGKEELDGVILALTQIASKGAVSAEEINQIAERVPQIRQAMLAAFGTASTEAIQKMGITSQQFIIGIIDQLEKLPKATSGMKNVMSNLGDFFNTALSDIGMGLNKYLIKPLEEVGRFGEYLKSLDVFTKIGENFGKMFGGVTGASPLIGMLALVVATLEELPAILGKVGFAVGLVFQKVMDGFVTVYNKIATSRIGALAGMETMDYENVDVGKFLQGPFAQNGRNILNRAGEINNGFNSYVSSPFTPGQGGTIAGGGSVSGPESELQQQTKYLAAIERNTAPQGRSIFGGGNLGAMGITPTDLSAIKTGRGGNEFDQIARLLERVVDKKAAQKASEFVRFTNNIIGGQ